MKKLLAILALSSVYASSAWSQCAPGVPCGGNPAGIPPTAPNSSYSQGADGNAAPITDPGPQLEWIETWGAFAKDDASGNAGTVENRDTRKEAEQLAVQTCERLGGQQCKVLFTFHNQCAAFTQPREGGDLNWSTGASTQVAEQRALAACKGSSACEVIYSKCSVPHQVRR